MHEVICVGSALLDIFMKSAAFRKVPSGDYEDGVALCEEFGGKTEVAELVVASGGAGTNNAVSFSRKGLKTAIIAEVGKDLVATTIKEELNREGVDLGMLVEVEGEETGLSSILVTPDGGRSAMIYRGASKMLTKADIRWDEVRASWLHISSLGGEMPLLEGLIGHGKTYGMKVAVNPGKSELEQLPAWGGLKLFEGIELLVMNREEAALMTGLPLEEESVWRSDWWLPGPHYAVITDGREGGLVIGEGQRFFYEALLSPCVEETGAGDAFGSGVAAAMLKGKDIRMAIEWGKKQAASVVSFMGAKRGLLDAATIGG